MADDTSSTKMDLHQYESEYENPTIEFLESQLLLLKEDTENKGDKKDNELVIIAEYLTIYNGFNEFAFQFFDNHNFNYDNEGRYMGDCNNRTIVAYSCEYRDFELLKKLHERGTNLHVLCQLDKINIGLIETLILGHSYLSYTCDISEMLQYLIDNKVKVVNLELILIQYIDNHLLMNKNVIKILISNFPEVEHLF